MRPKRKHEEEDMVKVPYASVVGSIMYAMVCTRPNIAHVVGVVCRYMENPRKENGAMVKRTLGTYETPLTMLFVIREIEARSFMCMGLLMPIDVKWVGNVDNAKSTNAYKFTLFELVNWKTKRQQVVSS
jgi:hypothetical protein